MRNDFFFYRSSDATSLIMQNTDIIWIARRRVDVDEDQSMCLIVYEIEGDMGNKPNKKDLMVKRDELVEPRVEPDTDFFWSVPRIQPDGTLKVQFRVNYNKCHFFMGFNRINDLVLELAKRLHAPLISRMHVEKMSEDITNIRFSFSDKEKKKVEAELEETFHKLNLAK